jgi:DNA invertase Pin-like site-specific DNA recombinase
MKVACYLWSALGPSRKRRRERTELQRWLRAHGVSPAEVEWYIDRESGPSTERKELGRLEADIAAGKVRAILLWKLSDLVTRFRAAVTMLASWCERGTRVVIVSHGIDLQPETSGCISPLLRALAETELEFRRDRQRRGIAVAKARGHFPGRKPGTTKEKPRRAIALREKGYTVVEIADALGISERTAFRYLGTFTQEKPSGRQ